MKRGQETGWKKFGGDFGEVFVREFQQRLKSIAAPAALFRPLDLILIAGETFGRVLLKMKKGNAKLLGCVVWVVLCVCAVTRAEDIKQIRPTGYVTDLAGIIQPQAKAQLEALCTELDQKTGAQMAIVTVKSLDGNEIQPYANDLFKQLGVGKKKQDNGILLLVAPNERKYWTEVGYGLEPVINDARGGDAGRMLVPYFRKGDYSGGITVAAAQLAKYIADDKGVVLTGIPKLPERRSDGEQLGALVPLLVLGFILFMILASASKGGSGRNLGGGGGMGSAWWIGSVLGAMGSGNRGGWGNSRGGWSSGGGWGGGGGGFGGFGGGSSGGGGAGGSW